MENATKALLIAAAILIAIVLIAMGVRLLVSLNNTGDESKKVENSMVRSSQSQTQQITTDLSGLTH